MTESENWVERVSGIIVDALIRAKVVETEDFQKALEITNEEINARLAVEDWPILRRGRPS